MAGSFTDLNLHVVFSTKERYPILSKDLRSVVFPYISGIVANLRGHLPIAGGVDDHVHLLLRLHQGIAIADCVRTIKSNVSKWIREQHDPTWLGWQDGYGAFTVSRSQLSKLEQYILNQAGHHARLSFQDEFREILRRHEIEFNEEFIWN